MSCAWSCCKSLILLPLTCGTTATKRKASDEPATRRLAQGDTAKIARLKRASGPVAGSRCHVAACTEVDFPLLFSYMTAFTCNTSLGCGFGSHLESPKIYPSSHERCPNGAFPAMGCTTGTTLTDLIRCFIVPRNPRSNLNLACHSPSLCLISCTFTFSLTHSKYERYTGSTAASLEERCRLLLAQNDTRSLLPQRTDDSHHRRCSRYWLVLWVCYC